MTTYAEPRTAVEPGQARAGFLSGRWPIFLILALQALVSVTMLHNTAFQDEALYLYAGRQIIHHWNGGPVPPDYTFYFSGYPYVYPVIGGFLDMIGGLELARSFSLACMLGVTTIVYVVTRKLFGQRAGFFAAAVYSAAGVVLFLGRLATFDAMCLFLIALATAFAVHGVMGRRPWITLAIGPVLVLAILAKYAALLLVPPVFGVLACVSLVFLGWWRALLRLALALAGFALSLGVAYEIMDKAAFHAISGSTTNRAVGLKAPRLALFSYVMHMGGLIFLLSFLGLLLLLRLQPRFRLLAVVLFGSSLLMPAYHIYMQEPVSLDKHIAYALFFAAPLAGYALAWLSGYQRQPSPAPYRGHWLAGVAIVLAIFTVGLGQSRTLYANWANTSGLSQALHTQVRDGSGRILAEDIEVAQFDAMDVTEPWQWNSFYYPYYITPSHHFLYGNQALVQAIKTRFYSWVELSFNYLPQSAYFLAGQMAATRNYDLIAVILFQNSYGKGHFYLWRSALVPGHGNFKSLAQLKTNDWGS
ncbi:MAG: ArnT family glycosyltransferase [Streptosporangiaceae bacterium]